jgi:TonB family protein
MTDIWNQWEGRVVDERFTLGRYLGGSDHSAVYATEIPGPETRRAAIKFVAESPQEDVQLHRWEIAAGLSHPNLLRVFASGTCRLDGRELLYTVMELAEEDLSQILPQRALTPDETRAMLPPVLDALAYLHGKGFAHTRIKPSNILAIGDQIKLSCDSICPSGAPMIQRGAKNLYEAPEATAGTAVPASDLWSLGVMLVEALRQHLPSWREAPSGELELAEKLPPPFQTILKHVLVKEPAGRWNSIDIQAELDPSKKSRATESVAEVARPPVVAAFEPQKKAAPAPARLAPQTPRASLPRQSSVRRISPLWFVIPGLASAAVLVAWIAITRSTPSAPPSSATASASDSRTTPPKKQRTASGEEHLSRADRPASKEKKREEKNDVPEATPASLSELTPKPGARIASKGQILDQVLPEVSQKARDTIWGTVRVGVRVHVEPSGSVSSAELDSPGPSKYFADQALKAAKQWEFIAPEVDGRSVASEWLVRFEFTQSSTKAFPRQVSP